LSSLKTRVNFENANDSNKQRILQLINKTNQMNLSTRRITESQLESLINNKNKYIFSCKVSDKFGDMGLVGVVSFVISSKKIEIIDFILSCRAFGRSIENSMLYKVIQVSKKKNIDQIIFKYLKTAKNKPCLDFLNSNLIKKKNNIFIHQNTAKFKPPKFLKII
jgi:Predicted enzyme involved in methoxymalonyl-ACP biosynthesis